MPRLRISADARRDLREINKYIARDKPVAARKWVGKIRQKCRLLSSHPDLGDACEELGKGIRSAYLGHYVIYFRSSNDFVEIVRVVRGDRDTKYL